MLGTLALITKSMANLEQVTSILSSVHRKCIKGTPQNRALTTGPASDTNTSPARQRRRRRWDAILPRTSRPLWQSRQAWGFYTHFSQARLLILANPTPNLLILIIDLVNKRRISNPHKYGPCLEGLKRWNISAMKYS